MNAQVQKVFDRLRDRGFAKFGGLLGSDLVGRLQAAGERLAVHESKSWSAATDWYVKREWNPSLFADEGQSKNYYDSLGVDAGLDQAIEDVIATPEIRELLDHAVGADRRMWFVQLRWAMPESAEYAIHQDLYGELGLCVYLSEHRDEKGSMVLWPESHRWPRLLEGFPLLLPKWVPDSVEFVDGGPGDICVFFNKTWHGRTTAVGAPRLVMLISFIPSGPAEMDRRLPEAARAGLGPELRKITAPDAALSFGDAPPDDPALSSSFELPENCPFTPEMAHAVRAYAWGWSRSACDGDEAPLERLRRYKTFVSEAMLSAVVPKDVIDFVLEDFTQRAEREGFGARASLFLRTAILSWNGEVEEAGRALAAARALPRDALCDAPELELEAVVRFYADVGDDDAVLEHADALLGAAWVPATAWAQVLLPCVRAGRYARALQADQAGYDQVRGNATFAREIGKHLEFAALRRDPAPALASLREHMGVAMLQHNAGGLWYFWVGAFSLFARMQAAGVELLDGPLPRLGDGPFGLTFLVDHFRDRLAKLAARLDERNGNTFRADSLRAIESRVNWDCVPESTELQAP